MFPLRIRDIASRKALSDLVLSSFPVKHCLHVSSHLCNYICCPEIENLTYIDFHSKAGVITAKLCMLLLTKSEKRYISKKRISNFKFKTMSGF